MFTISFKLLFNHNSITNYFIFSAIIFTTVSVRVKDDKKTVLIYLNKKYFLQKTSFKIKLVFTIKNLKRVVVYE